MPYKRHITFNGKSQTLNKWAKDLGVCQGTLYRRLQSGWSLEEAFTSEKRSDYGEGAVCKVENCDRRPVKLGMCQYHYKIEWKARNPERRREVYVDYIKRRDPRKNMWKNAKLRAVEKGLPFTITVEDIPMVDTCPYLDIPVRVSIGQVDENSPTLDRIVPELGYIPGNVLVVSMLGNRSKNNLTPEQLELLTARVKEHTERVMRDVVIK